MGSSRTLIAPEGSATNGRFPVHIQACQTCVLDQLIDAVNAEGSLARQQRVPFLAWKVRLQPEHTKNARGGELSQTLFEACCDEVQRSGSIFIQ